MQDFVLPDIAERQRTPLTNRLLQIMEQQILQIKEQARLIETLTTELEEQAQMIYSLQRQLKLQPPSQK